MLCRHSQGRPTLRLLDRLAGNRPKGEQLAGWTAVTCSPDRVKLQLGVPIGETDGNRSEYVWLRRIVTVNAVFASGARLSMQGSDKERRSMSFDAANGQLCPSVTPPSLIYTRIALVLINSKRGWTWLMYCNPYYSTCKRPLGRNNPQCFPGNLNSLVRLGLGTLMLDWTPHCIFEHDLRNCDTGGTVSKGI